MNSDVTMLWLDVLPRLKPGVIVHIHDVFLPYDYPPEWASRYYSEQYMLAASLLAGNPMEILFPSHFVQRDAALASRLDPLWEALGLDAQVRVGCLFCQDPRDPASGAIAAALHNVTESGTGAVPEKATLAFRLRSSPRGGPVASGSIRNPDGTDACRGGRRVIIENSVHGDWRQRGAAVTHPDGFAR